MRIAFETATSRFRNQAENKISRLHKRVSKAASAQIQLRIQTSQSCVLTSTGGSGKRYRKKAGRRENPKEESGSRDARAILQAAGP